MLRFKAGVRFHPLLAMSLALSVVRDVFAEHGLDAWITSANDSEHMPGSLHYLDRAVDLRLHHVPAHLRAAVVQQLRDRLRPDFDVLWEGQGTPNEHVHVEYDPKEVH